MPPFYGVYKCRMPLRAKVDLLQRNLDAAQEHANRPKPALSHAPGAYHGGFGAYFGLF